MEKEKKVYTPPIAEPILLAPSEDIAEDKAFENTWAVYGWQNKFKSASVIQATGKWIWNEDGTITGG